jgi:hypothetical protein
MMSFNSKKDQMGTLHLVMQDAPATTLSAEHHAEMVTAISEGEYAREMTPDQRAALERLIALAEQDGVQARVVADFLLAWWNAEECGGFDLTRLWRLDKSVKHDVTAVFAMVSNLLGYPDDHGYQADFERVIVKKWRKFPEE